MFWTKLWVWMSNTCVGISIDVEEKRALALLAQRACEEMDEYRFHDRYKEKTRRDGTEATEKKVQ